MKGPRGAIEETFETAKNELRIDHNETRSWRGWRRHVSLVMLAFAMLAAVKRPANDLPPPKSRAMETLRRWSVQEIRRVATRRALRQIEPAFVIAWSAWRRAHQAAARKTHIRRSVQL